METKPTTSNEDNALRDAQLAQKVYLISHPDFEDRLADGRVIDARKAAGWTVTKAYDSMEAALADRAAAAPAAPPPAVTLTKAAVGDPTAADQFAVLKSYFTGQAWARAKADMTATYGNLQNMLAAMESTPDKVITAIYGLTAKNADQILDVLEEAVDRDDDPDDQE